MGGLREGGVMEKQRTPDDDFLAGYEFYRKFMVFVSESEVVSMGNSHVTDFIEGMKACRDRDYLRYNRILG